MKRFWEELQSSQPQPRLLWLLITVAQPHTVFPSIPAFLAGNKPSSSSSCKRIFWTWLVLRCCPILQYVVLLSATPQLFGLQPYIPTQVFENLPCWKLQDIQRVVMPSLTHTDYWMHIWPLLDALQHPANFKVKWNHHPCLNYAHKLHEALELNLQLAIDLFWRNKSLVSHEWSPPTREDVLCGTLADRTEFLPDSGITEALQYTTLRAEKGSCLACLLFHNPLASTQNPLDI